MSEFRYNKLRGRIIEKFGSQSKFCEELGLSKVSMSKKMNGETGFSQDDVIKWSRLLDIDLTDVGSFFYD